MADSEGKNSESQAISLGIKWIKQNMPHIRLLVSYAGRKEGNYGYIYQATNWEYLGYFVSEGFWLLDGEEKHLTTLWYRYKQYANQELSFIDGICSMYEDVRKTWTKQFIYIIRLDKKLTPASNILPYPKPSNEYPIKIKEHIYKQNDDVFNSYKNKERQYVEYYYTKETQLFTNATLIRRGEKENKNPKYPIAVYNAGGMLESVWDKISNIKIDGYKKEGIRESIKTGKSYKNKYFRFYEGMAEEEIDVPYICIIDEIPFNSYSEVGKYMSMSRQAIRQAHIRRAKNIGKKPVIWVE